MSLPDYRSRVLSAKRFLSLGVVGLSLIAAGCQVRPLYSEAAPAIGSGGASGSVRSKLSTVAINQPGDRVTQEVRNHLIFLFAGGAGQPASPAYNLQMVVYARDLSLALVQNAINDKSGQPTAGSIRMTGNYVLTRVSDGQVVGRGTRIVTADYDAPRQRFAVVRAQRDANNRAARELAEALNLSVAQDLAKF
ncbi:LPS assembly lipoprotein LptE [Phyllobacterium sp. 21LDTY02-6]|uniref:LPS assembly lipoprotein LptE n=1 Tax=Phyllobacterium sp. 21LDTY02-6 TaxID=2944903 RepID=UPI0020218773|nr:LPS assembly lipoprotein LptE [Phyllobacterium sp. 21LDTY02-6]MCO4317465.1 LPS assembly lipoprotein LptE [Phyllobacterium sp. 21LDTY02-6]